MPMSMPVNAPPRMVQAKIGGMDIKTVLLVGGLGLGALLLVAD